MRRWLLSAMCLMLAWGAFPTVAWSQAATEYGMAAGKSVAIGAKTLSTFGARSKQLAERIQTRTSVPRNIMQENRQRLEEKGGAAGGTLHISSVPDKATISVDGVAVAYAPADLKVPEGTRYVQLTRAGFLPWRREVSVSRGGELSIRAKLENRYKSTVTLSKPK